MAHIRIDDIENRTGVRLRFRQAGRVVEVGDSNLRPKLDAVAIAVEALQAAWGDLPTMAREQLRVSIDLGGTGPAMAVPMVQAARAVVRIPHGDDVVSVIISMESSSVDVTDSIDLTATALVVAKSWATGLAQSTGGAMDTPDTIQVPSALLPTRPA